MTCEDLERALTALLAGEDDPADRAGRLAALRDHAEACQHCRDASDLLEFLSLPPAERDLVEPPDDAYWDEFETGLLRRVARSESPAARGWVPWSGVAAAFLLAAAALWLVFSPGGAGIPEQPAATPGEERGKIPKTLEALLRGAEPDEALAGLDFLGGLAGVPAAAPEAADAEFGADGPAEFGGLLYPDPEAMDAEARRALLDWLREREGRDRGVES